MTDTLLVDDHILLRVLLDDEPAELRPRGAAIATTGLWYHRLCRALADNTVVGVLSRLLGGVEPTVAVKAAASVVELPEPIHLVSLRDLAWPMARLVVDGPRLNLLALEALAAAEYLDASICLTSSGRNVALLEAAHARNVAVRSVSA